MIYNLFQSRATKLEAIHPSDGAPSVWAGGDSYSGTTVTPSNSQTYLAFGAIVRLISSIVARVPLKLYQRTSEGRLPLRKDPRYSLMHDEPNPETTSAVFRETLQGHACTWGNAVAEIAFEGGQVHSLWQKNPALMEVKRVKRAAGSREKLWYVYDNKTWLTPQEVLHVPWFTGMGDWGLSPVELHREDIGLGIAARETMAAWHGQGGWPGLIFERPREAGTLNPDEENAFLDRFSDRFQGPRKSSRAMITQEGTTARVLNIPFKDAQHLERTRLSIEDMARIFLMPSFVLGEDKSGQSFNSLEIKQRAVLDYGMMIWLVKWEQELNRKLLTKAERADGVYFEFDVGGFLRGDSQAQADIHDKYARMGVMSPDQILANLNLPALPDGVGAVPWMELNRQPMTTAALSQTPAERALLLEHAEERAQTDALLGTGRVEDDSEARAQRSLAARYKLRDAFFGVLQQNAARVVTSEVNALRREVDKIPVTGLAEFESWMAGFFGRHETFAAGVMGPPLFAYLVAVAREIAEELGRPEGDFRATVETFSAQYRDAFATRQARASHNKMLKIMRENAGEDNLVDLLQGRIADWEATGAGRIATRESTQGMGAISVAVYGFAGIRRLIWNWPGSKCGICPNFHGRTVEIATPFAKDGDTIKTPEGSTDYVVKSIISHPPAHGGCQCGVRPG